MNDILHEIVEKNRPQLEERKRLRPLAELEAAAKDLPAARGFAAAFAGPGIHVIAELKKASPSKGTIREELPVAELAAAFEAAGAAALSVLTEPFYFKGSLENLAIAARSTKLPLLRKDFIFDPYQIAEARCAGASAVLLIAAMLERGEFRRLCDCARSFGLDVLGEAHSESELETVREADLIGVNARDLHDFSTSLDRSADVIAKVTVERPVIAESAVRTPEEIRRLRRAGAHGFLIGETLMRAADPGAELGRLIRCSC